MHVRCAQELCGSAGVSCSVGGGNRYDYMVETGSELRFALGATGKCRVGYKSSKILFKRSLLDSEEWELVTY